MKTGNTIFALRKEEKTGPRETAHQLSAKCTQCSSTKRLVYPHAMLRQTATNTPLLALVGANNITPSALAR